MRHEQFPLDVIVYTQPGSVSSDLVRKFLRARGIDFIDKDIVQDVTAVQELRALGHLTVPVIRVGHDVIVGYNEAELERHFGPAPDDKA
jgi:hypothetical protein